MTEFLRISEKMLREYDQESLTFWTVEKRTRKIISFLREFYRSITADVRANTSFREATATCTWHEAVIVTR